MSQLGASFVADGFSRYTATSEHGEYRVALRVWLAEIYAPSLAEAGIFRRIYLRWLLRREFEHLWRELTPSEECYW